MTPAGEPAGVSTLGPDELPEGPPPDLGPGVARSSVGERRIAELGVLVVMVFWAANFIVVKAANEQIPPITFACLRFSIAAATLLLALRWREGTLRMPLRDVAPLLALGAVGFGLYQILWATALQDIPAGDSAIIVAGTPVITALLAVLIGTDVLTRTKLAGSLISFAGVALVIASGPGLGLQASIGDLLTLGATISWSIYSAFGASVLRRHSPLRATAWAQVGGSLVLLPLALVQGATAEWGSVEVGAWAGLAFSALLPAGFANVIVFHAIRLLGPTRVTVFQFLVPFIAVLMGAAFLAEPVRVDQLVGGAIIVLGVALTRTRRPADLVARLRGASVRSG